MNGRRAWRVDVLTLAVGLPPAILAMVCLGLALFGITGNHPFWPRTPISLPEAVAMRAGWEVLRQLADGVDPNTPGVIRAGLGEPLAAEMSAWESAVVPGRGDVLRLMLREGHRPRLEAARQTVCLARKRGSGDALSILAEAGVGIDVDCAHAGDHAELIR